MVTIPSTDARRLRLWLALRVSPGDVSPPDSGRSSLSRVARAVGVERRLACFGSPRVGSDTDKFAFDSHGPQLLDGGRRAAPCSSPPCLSSPTSAQCPRGTCSHRKLGWLRPGYPISRSARFSCIAGSSLRKTSRKLRCRRCSTTRPRKHHCRLRHVLPHLPQADKRGACLN